MKELNYAAIVVLLVSFIVAAKCNPPGVSPEFPHHYRCPDGDGFCPDDSDCWPGNPGECRFRGYKRTIGADQGDAGAGAPESTPRVHP